MELYKICEQKMHYINYSVNEINRDLAAGLARFHTNFSKNGNVYIEDSVLWYCIDMGIDWYLSLSIHDRINYKQSYFDSALS